MKKEDLDAFGKQEFVRECLSPNLIPEDNPYFAQADGIFHTEQLLIPSGDAVETRLEVPSNDLIRIQRHINLAIFYTLGNHGKYLRRLHNPWPEAFKAYDNYESLLEIKPGKIKDLIEQYCSFNDIPKASVFDSGCGAGIALYELEELDVVNSEKVVGITLPFVIGDGDIKTNFDSPNILLANILNIQPKTLFDIGFSVFGTVYYHPLGEQFGILQLIAAMKEKGLLFLAPIEDLDDPGSDLYETFIKSGILRKATEYKHFGANNKEPNVYMLEKKPTPEQMCKFVYLVYPQIEPVAA